MKAVLMLAAATAAALGAPRGADTPKTEAKPCEGASCCESLSAAPVLPVIRRIVANPDETGTIQGTVTWEGENPEKKPDLTIGEKESEGCTEAGHAVDKTDRSLLVSEKGGVANVVLTLEAEGVTVEVPADPILLDQLHCRFEPRVVVLPEGATLRFDNSDQVNHNIHTYSRKNDQVNKNVSGGTNFDQTLASAETFEVKCDIHPWMKSFVVVTDSTHWAVTDESGAFKIEGVPAGTYKLSWWHEELGKGKSAEVTVEAGQVATVAEKVGAAKKAGGGRRR